MGMVHRISDFMGDLAIFDSNSYFGSEIEPFSCLVDERINVICDITI